MALSMYTKWSENESRQLRYLPRNVLCFKELKQSYPDPVIKLLNITNIIIYYNIMARALQLIKLRHKIINVINTIVR